MASNFKSVNGKEVNVPADSIDNIFRTLSLNSVEVLAGENGWRGQCDEIRKLIKARLKGTGISLTLEGENLNLQQMDSFLSSLSTPHQSDSNSVSEFKVNKIRKWANLGVEMWGIFEKMNKAGLRAFEKMVEAWDDDGSSNLNLDEILRMNSELKKLFESATKGIDPYSRKHEKVVKLFSDFLRKIFEEWFGGQDPAPVIKSKTNDGGFEGAKEIDGEKTENDEKEEEEDGIEEIKIGEEGEEGEIEEIKLDEEGEKTEKGKIETGEFVPGVVSDEDMLIFCNLVRRAGLEDRVEERNIDLVYEEYKKLAGRITIPGQKTSWHVLYKRSDFFLMELEDKFKSLSDQIFWKKGLSLMIGLRNIIEGLSSEEVEHIRSLEGLDLTIKTFSKESEILKSQYASLWVNGSRLYYIDSNGRTAMKFLFAELCIHYFKAVWGIELQIDCGREDDLKEKDRSPVKSSPKFPIDTPKNSAVNGEKKETLKDPNFLLFPEEVEAFVECVYKSGFEDPDLEKNGRMIIDRYRKLDPVVEMSPRARRINLMYKEVLASFKPLMNDGFPSQEIAEKWRRVFLLFNYLKYTMASTPGGGVRKFREAQGKPFTPEEMLSGPSPLTGVFTVIDHNIRYFYTGDKEEKISIRKMLAHALVYYAKRIGDVEIKMVDDSRQEVLEERPKPSVKVEDVKDVKELEMMVSGFIPDGGSRKLEEELSTTRRKLEDFMAMITLLEEEMGEKITRILGNDGEDLKQKKSLKLQKEISIIEIRLEAVRQLEDILENVTSRNES